MTRIYRAAVAAAVVAFLLQSAASPSQRKKKKDEDFTQTLEALPEPPLTRTGETLRLNLLTSPLSSKGLLSQQTRDALKVLITASRGGAFVRIRAFVAGTGDLRRVQAILAELFTERKLTLPVVSVVQVGALPMEGAQVQIEAVLQDRRVLNPQGLAFLSGQAISGPLPVPARAASAGSQLKAAAAAAGSSPEDVMQVTCFLPTLDGIAAVQASTAALFPRAQLAFVQTQRLPEEPVVECEGIARLRKAPSRPVQFLNPESLPKSANYSQVAMVSAPQLVFAGSQLAFRYQEADARLAFTRLEKTMQAAGTSLKRVVKLNTYPLSTQLADLVRKVRFDYLDLALPPASTMLPFEGLPSMDASFSLEAVAVAGPGGPSTP